MNPQAETPAPLTRRELRELRAAEAAQAEMVQAEMVQAETVPAEPAPVDSAPAENAAQDASQVPNAVAEAPVAVAAPLTRRQLREREQHDFERERELRAEELATLEVAEIGTSDLEPAVDLPLEAVQPESADALAEPAPLHLVQTRRGPRRPIAPAPSPKLSRTAAPSATNPPARRRSGWAKSGLTAVAMAFVLGITAVTALPSTVSASPVDANVVNLSLNANTTEQTQQLITSNAASSASVDRDGYAVSDVGELQAAGYSTAQLLVGRSLAQELVNAMDAGKLVGSQPDHMKEIRWIAQGVTVADCGVDYRILEIIAIAVRNFDQVGVSDINRKCTGQIEGAGTGSSHYIDGGGHAVDFYLLDNKSLNGADAGTLKMIGLLDPVMPVGARVGQAGCRTSAGVSLQLTNWTEFDDSCTHMHIDVPVTDAPLLLNDDSLLATK